MIQNSLTGARIGINDSIHNTVTTSASLVKTYKSHNPGNTRTIYQDSHYTTHVGASQLTGGGAFVAAYLCVASYNGNYTAFNSICYQVQPRNGEKINETQIIPHPHHFNACSDLRGRCHRQSPGIHTE